MAGYLINAMPTPITEAHRQRLLAMDTGSLGHVLDQGFMDSLVRTALPGVKIAGTAVTVRSTLPDSVIGHYALKWLRPADILVIDRGQDVATACWGGTTSLAAKKLGVMGLIMDGAGNDLDEAAAVGFPIWCRGVTPVTTKYRGLGGEMNIPISCGGVAVNPGDAILADDNGVVVIRVDQLDAVLDQSEAMSAREHAFRASVLARDRFCYPDESGATAILAANLDPRSTLVGSASEC